MGHVDIPNTPGNVEERTTFSNMRWKKEEEEGEKRGKTGRRRRRKKRRRWRREP